MPATVEPVTPVTPAKPATPATPAEPVKLSHLDKVLFPEHRITKGELIEYYRTVAGRMLPQLHDRPLALARYPNGISAGYEVRKNKRGGRLFLDNSRNAYAQLIVAPYTVRANAEARVATPLAWSELEEDDVSPGRFTLRTMDGRLAQPDPWRDAPAPISSLTTARRRIGDLAA
jgi:DNA primase